MALPKLFSQQSPPSYSHPALLLPSLQLPSPLYCSNLHADAAALGALGFGSKHLHAVQNCLEMALPKLFSQQSPPSYSHPALLLPSSQMPSPLYCLSSHAGGALEFGSKHLHAVQYFLETA